MTRISNASLPMEVTSTPAKPANRVSIQVIQGFVRLVDVLIVVAAGAAAASMWGVESLEMTYNAYTYAILLGGLLSANFFHFANVYEQDVFVNLSTSLKRVLLSWIGTAASLTVIGMSIGTWKAGPPAWAVAWFASVVVVLAAVRFGLRLTMRHWRRTGRLDRHVAIVGVGPAGQHLLSQLAYRSVPGVKIVGVFDDNVKDGPDYYCGVPVLGGVDALVGLARNYPIDTVIVAWPWSDTESLQSIVDRLRTIPVNIRLCPDTLATELPHRGFSELAGVPVVSIVDRPLSDWRLLAKEVEDCVLGTAILILIAPLMAMIAAAIKLDTPGPVLFRQKRYGFNDQLIEVLKFRTMHNDQRDDQAEQLTRRDDPRITRVGAFLRKRSLDELPQFINVLRGEMSIVGPRPHACRAKAGNVLYQDAVAYYSSRHRMKPGITGLAQVNGFRGETKTIEQIRRRVEFDVKYVESWSLWLDFKIIARTAFTGFTGSQAY